MVDLFITAQITLDLKDAPSNVYLQPSNINLPSRELEDWYLKGFLFSSEASGLNGLADTSLWTKINLTEKQITIKVCVPHEQVHKWPACRRAYLPVGLSLSR